MDDTTQPELWRLPADIVITDITPKLSGSTRSPPFCANSRDVNPRFQAAAT
jgi:hypothetical protein